MRLFRGSALRQEDADPAHFTGTARLTRTTGVSDEPGVTIYRVEFDPKARTDWHAHTGPQLLLILDGRCRIQTWGEAVRELEPGDTACVEPNEKHWHGAGADAAMTHTDAVFGVLTVEDALKSRNSFGGAAPERVKEAVAEARKRFLN